MKKNIKKFFSHQGIRFLLVGGLNTVVGYGVYALLLYLGVNYLIANTISTIVGVAHSYLWNRFFTFKSKEKAGAEIVRFVSVYIVSYLIGMGTLYIFKQVLNISPYIAGLINLVITTLISWFGHKYFSFNDKILNKNKKEHDKNIPTKFEWIFAIWLFAFLFIVFLYNDILVTTNFSIAFDKLILKGQFYHLYEATYHAFGGMFDCQQITYDFPIYIFFGIWNTPLAVITHFSNIHWEETLWGVYYAKLFLILLLFLNLKVISKILELFQLDYTDKKMYNYLYISSAFTLLIVAMFGGYELLSMLFALLGIYFYLKDNNKLFLLFFAIAISIKLFALFIFIPLLLMKEKNIWKIILYGFCGVSLLLFSKLYFMHAPMYYESMHGFEGLMSERFMKGIISSGYGGISIFALLFVIICFYAYSIKDDYQSDLFKLNTMYIPFIIYMLFLTFIYCHPQWYILIVPYEIFFLIINKKNRKINLILDIAISVSAVALLFLVFNSVFIPWAITPYTILKYIVPSKNYYLKILPFIEHFHLVDYKNLVSSVFFGSLLYFSYINNPKKILANNKKNIEPWNHPLLWLRMCIIIPFAAIILYYYFR